MMDQIVALLVVALAFLVGELLLRADQGTARAPSFCSFGLFCASASRNGWRGTPGRGSGAPVTPPPSYSPSPGLDPHSALANVLIQSLCAGVVGQCSGQMGLAQAHSPRSPRKNSAYSMRL